MKPLCGCKGRDGGGSGRIPVEVNVFSLDPSGGSALRKTTSVPPSTFTVQTIEGLPSVDATAGIEAVMAPNIQSAAMR